MYWNIKNTKPITENLRIIYNQLLNTNTFWDLNCIEIIGPPLAWNGIIKLALIDIMVRVDMMWPSITNQSRKDRYWCTGNAPDKNLHLWFMRRLLYYNVRVTNAASTHHTNGPDSGGAYWSTLCLPEYFIFFGTWPEYFI